MINQKLLKECLSYNQETGEFIWLKRPLNHFQSKIAYSAFNGRHPGCIAGYVNSHGYLKIQLNGKKYGAHQLAWIYYHGKTGGHEIDHINGIRTDNRIENVRIVDHATNSRNQRKPINNSSGVVGVHWHSKNRKWIAQIGKVTPIYLGSFDTKAEAIKARKNAEIKYGFHDNHGNCL